jgi:8-oxo-dGTP diphosphatase
MQRVTAALLVREGRVLLALRKAGKHMGRKWEFPGGKIRPGESPEECLRRELAEELAIEARVGGLVGTARYRNEAVEVDLEILLYRAEYLSGAFTLHEHEALAWVEPGKLESYDLADSDRELARQAITALKNR